MVFLAHIDQCAQPHFISVNAGETEEAQFEKNEVFDTRLSFDTFFSIVFGKAQA